MCHMIRAYFDERRACNLHLANEKIIPPNSPPPISTVLLFRFSYKQHRTAYDDRDKQSEEVDETFGSEDWLPYLISEKSEYARREGPV